MWQRLTNKNNNVNSIFTLLFPIHVVMISHDNKNTTLKWIHQWCLLPWNDAKDLTLKLRVAKTGEEEQRAPAKRQRRKRQERRQEAPKDFGDFGMKQIWSKGEKCGNMVDGWWSWWNGNSCWLGWWRDLGELAFGHAGRTRSSCSFLGCPLAVRLFSIA